MSKDQDKRLPNVAVIASTGFRLFHLSLPFAVFGETLAGKNLFDVTLYGADNAGLTSPVGLSMEAPHNLDKFDWAEIVVVPFWPSPDEPPKPILLNALNRAYEKGAQLVGLGYGVYALAYAGLLTHKQATTHWENVQDFRRRFPDVHLNTNVLYIDDDRVITSAGTAAGLDCCMYIVKKIYGSVIANEISRKLIIFPHREGSQAQYIDRALPVSSQDQAINTLLQELRLNYAQKYSLDSLATKVMMSRRTFTRYFHKATGMSVVEWLTATRLQRAQELLESTGNSIDEIAQKTGFQSSVIFRKHFKHKFHMNPTAWRKTFQKK